MTEMVIIIFWSIFVIDVLKQIERMWRIYMWVIFLGWAALAVIGVTVIGSVVAMIANKVRLKMLKDNKEAEKDMKEEKK